MMTSPFLAVLGYEVKPFNQVKISKSIELAATCNQEALNRTRLAGLDLPLSGHNDGIGREVRRMMLYSFIHLATSQ